MTKYLTIALLLLGSLSSTAQSSRNDTIKLSVYNTGLAFNLTKADFGGAVTQTIIGEMVRSYDTIIVRKDIGRDTNNRRKIRYVVERDCNKMTANLRDKIAVMELNKDCDVTLTCLKVQRAGAKALVIIHNSNSNGNIKLPRQGAYRDSIRIPIFTVGKEKGGNITALLPTIVGLKAPSTTTAMQSNVPTDSLNQKAISNADKTVNTESTTEDNLNNAALDVAQGRKGWRLSPNPTTDYAQLDYNFSQATDITVIVFNETGQLIHTYQQKATSVGSFQIDVHHWANGVYTVRLQNGGKQEVKKLMVQH